MMFDQLASDRIYVTKADGTRTGPYKAVVDRGSIVCLDKEADFDPGDMVARDLPSGKKDVYYVVDATFHDGGMAGIDMSSWEVTTTRTPLDESDGSTPTTTTINVHGAQNVQIGDGNRQVVTNAFEQLVGAVDSSDASEEEKEDAKGLLRSALEHPILLALVGGASGAFSRSVFGDGG